MPTLLVFYEINPYNFFIMANVNSRLSVDSKFGRVFILIVFVLTLFTWLLNTPPGLFGKADSIGYAVCHRIDLRSFYFGERQMPLCARCSGMYLGAMLGLVYQRIASNKRVGMLPKSIIIPTAFFALAFIADGVNSFLSIFPGSPNLYEPNNTLRLITGTGMGLAIAIILYPAFNATVWQLIDPRPPFENFKSFAVLVALGIGLIALVLLENPIILYPLAIISAAGVILLLTLVYTMVLVMVFRVENRYNHWNQVINYLIAGLTLAIIQIGILDFLRFFLTGTWEGFHL